MATIREVVSIPNGGLSLSTHYVCKQDSFMLLNYDLCVCGVVWFPVYLLLWATKHLFWLILVVKPFLTKRHSCLRQKFWAMLAWCMCKQCFTNRLRAIGLGSWWTKCACVSLSKYLSSHFLGMYGFTCCRHRMYMYLPMFVMLSALQDSKSYGWKTGEEHPSHSWYVGACVRVRFGLCVRGWSLDRLHAFFFLHVSTGVS